MEEKYDKKVIKQLDEIIKLLNELNSIMKGEE